MRLSYIEIFKEEIKDLLNPITTKRLSVSEDKNGPTIKGELKGKPTTCMEFIGT